MVGCAPWEATAHVGWTTASAGVRQGHPAPVERSRRHERPLVWKAVRHMVVKPVVVLWQTDDWLMKRCLGLWWNESQSGANLQSKAHMRLAFCTHKNLIRVHSYWLDQCIHHHSRYMNTLEGLNCQIYQKQHFIYQHCILFPSFKMSKMFVTTHFAHTAVHKFYKTQFDHITGYFGCNPGNFSDEINSAGLSS